MFFSPLPQLLIAYALAVLPISSGQLVGCDAIDCPTVYRQAHCIVGNSTLNILGISNLSTSISPKPLTWTIGLQTVEDPAYSTSSFYDRDYYLGTPPSVQLSDVSSFRGCALFFEGIASKLSFPGPSEYSIGTCSDALSASCVSELLSQAQSAMQAILIASGQNRSESAVCASLQSQLQNSAPKSCSILPNQSWGTIITRSLTGHEASPVISNPECHATTGKDYSLILVQSSRSASTQPMYEILKPLLLGITPIMTVFYPFAQNVTMPLSSSDIRLNCMKVVESTAGEVGSSNSTSTAGRVSVEKMLLIGAAGLFGSMFSF